MKTNNKHLYWVIGLIIITLILCGTLLWINSHSWTLRFEMDDNTKEAIESIKWEEINNQGQVEEEQCDCRKNNENNIP